jgi:uncharacterized RDD family membrane protein YckC
MPRVQENTPSTPDDTPAFAMTELRVVPHRGLAGFGARLAAFVVDQFVLTAVMLLAALLIPGRLGTAEAVIVDNVILLVYAGIQLMLWSRTLGMRALGLHVVSMAEDRRGQRITAGQAWLRTAVFTVPGALPLVGLEWSLIDPMYMLWDKPYRQTLHDKIAGTVVVSERL